MTTIIESTALLGVVKPDQVEAGEQFRESWRRLSRVLRANPEVLLDLRDLLAQDPEQLAVQVAGLIEEVGREGQDNFEFDPVFAASVRQMLCQ